MSPATIMTVSTVALLLENAVAQVPSSPCPNIFQYVRGSDDAWRGQIFIRPPPKTLQINLRVHAFLTTSLQSTYVGRLVLGDTSDTAARKILTGSRELIKYDVFFPLKRPLPTIDRILVNQDLICQGPKVNSAVLTSILLDYKFTAMKTQPEGNNIAPTIKPNFQTQPEGTPTQQKLQTTQPVMTITEPSTKLPKLSSKEKDDFPAQDMDFLPTSPKATQNTQVVEQKTEDICGRSIIPNELILHGKRTYNGEWPWIVAIFINSSTDNAQFQCGGTLINREHVITAGHCIKLIDEDNIYSEVHPSALIVYVGMYTLQNTNDNFIQRREVEQIYIHPDFQATSNYDADIAVLKLANSVKYTQHVQPICLWPYETDLKQIVGKLGTVVGWGLDESGHKSTNEPRRTDVPIVSELQCLHSNAGFPYITSDRTFCAGFRNDSGPCNGDIGSGLMLKLSDGKITRWYLRGITSVSLYDSKENRCDLKNYVVFTDVAKFGKWLGQFMI